jgi:hypothetical protein
MKHFISIILMSATILLAVETNAQVGIGIAPPDSSAVLELYSTSRGFLMTRLTTEERDIIVKPAKGLMIYNLSNNEVQVNTGTPLLPVWSTLHEGSIGTLTSINSSIELTTSSTSSELIPGMILTPGAGTYIVMFNGQYKYCRTSEHSTRRN